jgi:predicted nucleic acid-binding protein
VIVADTNVLIYLFVDSPFTKAATALAETEEDWLAPALWRSEFRNALSLFLRLGELSLKDVLSTQLAAETFMQDRDYSVPSTDVLLLADSSRCTAYDCEFVALAQQNACPLVTMDRKLVKAFPETARLLTG